MAKIFYNGNRIIIDGHAETAEECRAITAMCDSMANNENFRTIVYESGHAVFEQVSGGESELFAFSDYVLTTRYNSEVLGGASYSHAKAIQTRLDDLEADQVTIEQYNELLEQYNELARQIDNILASIHKLPYTATELEAKLANL